MFILNRPNREQLPSRIEIKLNSKFYELTAPLNVIESGSSDRRGDVRYKISITFLQTAEMTSGCSKRKPGYRWRDISVTDSFRTMKSQVHKFAHRKEWTASGGTTASDWCVSRRENARVDETNSQDANFSEANWRTCVPHHPPPYDSDPNGAPAQSVPWARARLVDVHARAQPDTRAPIRCRFSVIYDRILLCKMQWVNTGRIAVLVPALPVWMLKPLPP